MITYVKMDNCIHQFRTTAALNFIKCRLCGYAKKATEEEVKEIQRQCAQDKIAHCVELCSSPTG